MRSRNMRWVGWLVLWGALGLTHPATSEEEPLPTPENSIVPPPRFNFSSVGGRAAGLGGAFVGLVDDGTAAWFNPAGLAQLYNWQLAVDGRRFARLTRDPTGKETYEHSAGLQFINVTRPVAALKGTVGLSFATITDTQGSLIPTTGASVSAAQTYEVLSLSGATRLDSWTRRYPGELYVGASLNYVDHELTMDAHPRGVYFPKRDGKQNWGGTLGLLYIGAPDEYGASQFQVGLSYRSRVALGRTVAVLPDQVYSVFNLPPELTLGVAYFPGVSRRPIPLVRTPSPRPRRPEKLPPAPASLSLRPSSTPDLARVQVSATTACWVQVYQETEAGDWTPWYGEMRGSFYPLPLLGALAPPPGLRAQPYACLPDQTPKGCRIAVAPDLRLLLVVAEGTATEEEFVQHREAFLQEEPPTEGWWVVEYRLLAPPTAASPYQLQATKPALRPPPALEPAPAPEPTPAPEEAPRPLPVSLSVRLPGPPSEAAPRLMVSATSDCWVQVYQETEPEVFAPWYGEMRGSFYPLSLLAAGEQLPASARARPYACRVGETSKGCPFEKAPDAPDFRLLLVVAEEEAPEDQFVEHRERFLAGDYSREPGWWVAEYKMKTDPERNPFLELQTVPEKPPEKERIPVRERRDWVITLDLETVFGKTLGGSGRNVVNPHLGMEKRFDWGGQDFFLRAGAFRLNDAIPRRVFGYETKRDLESQDFYSLGVGVGPRDKTQFNVAFEHSNLGYEEWTLGAKYPW